MILCLIVLFQSCHYGLQLLWMCHTYQNFSISWNGQTEIPTPQTSQLYLFHCFI